MRQAATLALLICGCGNDATQAAAPDLSFLCWPSGCSPAGFCQLNGYHCQCFSDGTGFCEPDCMGNGCNGLLRCYIDCNQANPVQSCFDDCDASATQQARDLLKAFGDCIDANCYSALNADSGLPFCDTNSANPTADPVCNDCYNRILGNGGACRASQTACTNDKP